MCCLWQIIIYIFRINTNSRKIFDNSWMKVIRMKMKTQVECSADVLVRACPEWITNSCGLATSAVTVWFSNYFTCRCGSGDPHDSRSRDRRYISKITNSCGHGTSSKNKNAAKVRHPVWFLELERFATNIHAAQLTIVIRVASNVVDDAPHRASGGNRWKSHNLHWLRC